MTLSLGNYKNPLRDAVLQFKFHHKKIVASALVDLLSARIQEAGWKMDWIVPVPMSHHRWRTRGYNPAGVIAERLVPALGGRAADAIRIRRSFRHQVGLGMRERRENVRDAFQFKEGFDFTDQSVLIVDDVTTTGATLSECAKAVKKGNPARIFAATLAYEERNPS